VHGLALGIMVVASLASSPSNESSKREGLENKLPKELVSIVSNGLVLLSCRIW